MVPHENAGLEGASSDVILVMGKLVKQSRSVLAGAYISSKTLLTHMVMLPEGDMAEGDAVCGRVKEGHLADGYDGDPTEAPTCPRCLAKWNKTT